MAVRHGRIVSVRRLRCPLTRTRHRRARLHRKPALRSAARRGLRRALRRRPVRVLRACHRAGRRGAARRARRRGAGHERPPPPRGRSGRGDPPRRAARSAAHHAGRGLRAANVEPAERLARAAAARRGARFLFISSSSVYGNAAVLPTPEHAPLAPLNRYAESKVAAEAAVLARGGDPVVVRPFTVYGPGQRPDMAFARWSRALGPATRCPGTPRRARRATSRSWTTRSRGIDGRAPPRPRGRGLQRVRRRPVPLREALALLAGGEPAEL